MPTSIAVAGSIAPPKPVVDILSCFAGKMSGSINVAFTVPSIKDPGISNFIYLKVKAVSQPINDFIETWVLPIFNALSDFLSDIPKMPAKAAKAAIDMAAFVLAYPALAMKKVIDAITKEFKPLTQGLSTFAEGIVTQVKNTATGAKAELIGAIDRAKTASAKAIEAIVETLMGLIADPSAFITMVVDLVSDPRKLVDELTTKVTGKITQKISQGMNSEAVQSVARIANNVAETIKGIMAQVVWIFSLPAIIVAEIVKIVMKIITRPLPMITDLITQGLGMITTAIIDPIKEAIGKVMEKIGLGAQFIKIIPCVLLYVTKLIEDLVTDLPGLTTSVASIAMTSVE